jgi:AcrR family transcriptional regulator
VLVKEAAQAIAEQGPTVLSLRELARRAGVSHAAPAHHFGDKEGLLRAVAAEGFRLLAADLRTADEQTGDVLEVGAAYVAFALRQTAYFEVMFRSDLQRSADPELLEALQLVQEQLSRSAARIRVADSNDTALAGVAFWALVHGVAVLALSGNLPESLGERPSDLVRDAIRLALGPS